MSLNVPPIHWRRWLGSGVAPTAGHPSARVDDPAMLSRLRRASVCKRVLCRRLARLYPYSSGLSIAYVERTHEIAAKTRDAWGGRSPAIVPRFPSPQIRVLDMLQRSQRDSNPTCCPRHVWPASA